MTKQQVQKFINNEEENIVYWTDRAIKETDTITKQNCLFGIKVAIQKREFWINYPTVD